MGSRGRSSNGARSGGSSRGSFNSSGRFSTSNSYYSSRNTNGLLGFMIGSMLSSGDGEFSVSSNYVENQVQKYKKVRNKKATAIVSAILGIITLVFIILSACAVDISYGKVMGTVVRKPYERDEWGEKYYYSSYKYKVDGKTYSSESNVGWTMLPDPIEVYVGNQYELYYKRRNPYDIYEVEYKENIPSSKEEFMAIAVIFALATIITACVGFRKNEINPEWQEEQKRIEEQNQMMGKKRCEYCSNITEDDNAKCPQCGAPL